MINDDILKAIETGAAIEIEYTKSDGTTSVRRLSEVQFSDEYGKAYIDAFCHLRNERRSFKIDRISRVTFVDSAEDSPGETGHPDQPYMFDGNKKIFALYGFDFN